MTAKLTDNRNNEIESIFTNRTEKYYYVNVNFVNGTCGTHAKKMDTGVWYDTNLTSLEISVAKKLALVDGKWTNYRKSVVVVTKVLKRDQDDEVLADIEAERFYNTPRITPAESELFG